MASAPGKLIVLEGLDGSGKSVQFALLSEYLQKENIPFMTVDFPDYQGSFFGRLVGRYLDGEFGDVYEVSPYVSSLLYAGDRLESQPKLKSYIDDGLVVLANRYAGSNMAYHSAKLPPEQRPEFIDWLKRLEFEANHLPEPDLVLYFNASAATSHRMVAQKAARSYTGSSHDIHERNQTFLEVVGAQYLWLCENEPRWQRMDVTDADGNMQPREEIHKQILALLADKKILEKA